MVAAYYKYKKESINLKFNSAKDTLKLMQGAIKEYKSLNSIYLRRSMRIEKNKQAYLGS
ncbi:hypothetical protein [Clostridium sp.]|uniref:hypothetical protein n=1 Tax=Clostridium sp. TaxID=1506 RepID=UPI0025C431E8|nr:hypothetical protein [Clostridium sp.]